jgi:hypothetical protein
MKSETWGKIGKFNSEYRLHLDNEWLGRLAEAKVKRVHMVESTAPIDYQIMLQVRPWLANVMSLGGDPNINRIMRHNLPIPLVTRLIHKYSGMMQIVANPELRVRSQEEHNMLMRRFQRIPW